MSSYPKNSCHERNVMGQAISLQGTIPKECHTTRLRVVPHFSSGNEKRVRVKITPREKLFSFPTASRLSRVGWFSHALAFRSLYYPWGKMGTTRSLLYHKSSKEFITVMKQEIWWHKESFTPESDMTRVNLTSRKREGHKEFYTPRNFTPSGMRYQRNHTLR